MTFDNQVAISLNDSTVTPQIHIGDEIKITVDAEWSYKVFLLKQLAKFRDGKVSAKQLLSALELVHSKKVRFITTQLATYGHGSAIYTHPDSPVSLVKQGVKHFQTPFAPFDLLGLDYRPTTQNTEGEYQRTKKGSVTLDLNIFSSINDPKSLFADESVFDTLFGVRASDPADVKLAKTRRWRVQNGKSDTILLPWEIQVLDKKEKVQWATVAVKITDISAIMGICSLGEAASNVGIKMDVKDTFTKDEKGQMDIMAATRPQEFIEYAMGDVLTADGKPLLCEIHRMANDKYNQIARDILGINPRASWGMSTGIIVARMLTDWLSNQPQIAHTLDCIRHAKYEEAVKRHQQNPAKYKKAKLAERWELLYLANKHAGTQGVANAGRSDMNKDLATYAAMVDGGRAVAHHSAYLTFVTGKLVDIDIAGCYANGLRVQDFAVGNPRLYAKPIILGDFLKQYRHRLVPGLWTSRISWKDAPFGCDLIISKIQKEWAEWENSVMDTDEDGLQVFSEEGDTRVYDASMVLQLHSIDDGALTHDVLQVLEQVASRREWSWLLENAVISNAALYLAEDEVKEANTAMFRDTIYTHDSSNGKVCYDWVRIPLKRWIEPLIEERGRHAKGTPMNVFIKLICNTTYGVIASQFFSGAGTGISDVVTGNNITARARVLGWMMEKSLGTLMTITDGGVFDINNVIEWKKLNLNSACQLGVGNYWDANRHRTYTHVPLMGSEVEVINELKSVDKQAWEWVCRNFPAVDICKFNQYEFESKSALTELVFHSKSDYQLKGVTEWDKASQSMITPKKGGEVVKMRGTRKENRKQQLTIFDNARANKGVMVAIESESILSLADFRKGLSTGETTHLSPGDNVVKRQNWYSVTPLALRWYDANHFKVVMKMYDDLRKENDAEAIRLLTKCDVEWYVKTQLNQ